MPVIQNYSAQERPSVGSPVNATGEQFGAGIGRQLNNVAGAVSQVGQDIEGIYQRKRERDATAFMAKELTSLQLEAKTKFESLKNEVEDVNTFSDTFKGWYKERADSVLAKAPNNLAKESFATKSLQLSADLESSAIEYQARQVVEIQKGDALSAISNLSNTIAIDPRNFENYRTQASQIVESSKRFMTPAETQKFYRDTNNEIYSARIMAEIDSNPYGVKNLLASEEYRSNIDSGTFQRLNSQIDNVILAQEKKALEMEERNASLATVGLALDGRAILDPFNKDTKKAVDLYYNEFAQDLQTMSPPERLQAQVNFVSKLGVYPSAMESAISAQLNNGSAEQKVQAAEFIDSIAVNNPSTVTQINESQRARARSIVDNINAGLQPSKAVETAEAMAFKKDTPEYKQRLENFNRKGGDKQSFKPRDFRETFRNDPDEIPASMQADWELLNQNFYMEGLDATQSAELATNTVKSQWAITNADGSNRWMKYAPEAVYKNEAGSDWIKEQLESEISQMPSITGSGNKNKLYLAVDPRTIKSPNKAYQIFEKDENGIVQPYLTGSGEQAIFYPNFKESPMYKRLLEENNNNEEEAMEAAIMSRKRAVLKEEEARINKKRKLDRSKAFTDKIDRLFDANN